MTRKLQALRVTLDSGEKVYFFGPATLDTGEQKPVGVNEISFSNQFEYQGDLTLDELWLLVQASEQKH